MKNKSQTNLGTEPIGSLLLKMSVPAITAQVINALYNIIDRIYIGHMPEVGPLALTGVGLTFPIIILISAFAALIGLGGAPRASIKMGENDYDGAEKILGNCFAVMVATAAVLTTIFLIFRRPLLLTFGASENTIGYASDYLQIYVSGSIFVMITVGMNAFITAQGFAKVSMLTTLIGAIINIILDPILIFGLGLGVRGAALASIISQGISAGWVLLFLFGKKTTLKIHKKNLMPDWRVMGPVLALGLGPFVMQATESLVNLTLNTSLQRLGGDVYVGAMTILSSVMMFMLMPLTGLGQGAQPIMGFNFGARQFDRVKKTFRLMLICMLGFTVVLWALVMLSPQIFVSIFNNDPTLTDVTVWALRIFMGGIFIFGAQVACQQAFLAVGQAKISLLLALLRKVILLMPLVLILPNLFGLGITGVFLAEPVADIVATTITVIVFVTQFPKILKRAQNPPATKETK